MRCIYILMKCFIGFFFYCHYICIYIVFVFIAWCLLCCSKWNRPCLTAGLFSILSVAVLRGFVVRNLLQVFGSQIKYLIFNLKSIPFLFFLYFFFRSRLFFIVCDSLLPPSCRNTRSPLFHFLNLTHSKSVRAWYTHSLYHSRSLISCAQTNHVPPPRLRHGAYLGFCAAQNETHLFSQFPWFLSFRTLCCALSCRDALGHRSLNVACVCCAAVLACAPSSCWPLRGPSLRSGRTCCRVLAVRVLGRPFSTEIFLNFPQPFSFLVHFSGPFPFSILRLLTSRSSIVPTDRLFAPLTRAEPCRFLPEWFSFCRFILCNSLSAQGFYVLNLSPLHPFHLHSTAPCLDV